MDALVKLIIGGLVSLSLFLYMNQGGYQPERWENATMRAGHAAFAAGRYDEALERYRRAVADGIRMGKVENWLPELIATVEARRAMGAIAPADTHRVGVVFVREVVTANANGGTRRVRLDVTDEQQSLWRNYLATLRQVMEVFSDGSWTLAFEEVDATATAPERSREPSDAEHLGLDRWFFDRLDRLDTYITFSHTTTAAGGMAHYPIIAGTLTGPARGFVSLNPNHDWTFMLHEFFHALEDGGGVALGHAYRDTLRHRVPEWRGDNEFDYYRWQFRTRFAPRWSRLNYRQKYAVLPAAVRLPSYDRIKAVYDTIPLARRRAARALADSARRMRDRAAALPLYERALAMSPYDPLALRDVDRILAPRERGLHRYSQQVAAVKNADEMVPEEAAGLGTVIGTWRPTDITETGSELEWDASTVVTQPGAYEVVVWYRDGWHAVRIEWVALLEDGREVARDAHEGRSGTRRENVSYALTLPERRPGSKYTVRARVYGLGGRDSNGLVFAGVRR